MNNPVAGCILVTCVLAQAPSAGSIAEEAHRATTVSPCTLSHMQLHAQHLLAELHHFTDTSALCMHAPCSLHICQ